MLSVETKAKLRSFLVAIAEGEISIEKQRRALGKIIKFEPYSAFQRIDRRRTGYIDSMDILNFLRDNGFTEETEADTYYLMKFFDVDDDQKLNYTEFLTMVLPCDSAKLRSEITQRKNYYVGLNDYLAKAIEYELCKLFVKEIAFHRRTENLKQDLAVTPDFDAKSGFKTIDDWTYNYIDFSNLKRFLKSQFYIPTNKDLTAIIRRMDLNADSRLSFDEFEEGLKPSEPYSKVIMGTKTKVTKTTKSKKKLKRPKTAMRSRPQKITKTAEAYGHPDYSPKRLSKGTKAANKTQDVIFVEEEKHHGGRPQTYHRESRYSASPTRQSRYESPHRAMLAASGPRGRSPRRFEETNPRNPPPGIPQSDHSL